MERPNCGAPSEKRQGGLLLFSYEENGGAGGPGARSGLSAPYQKVGINFLSQTTTPAGMGLPRTSPEEMELPQQEWGFPDNPPAGMGLPQTTPTVGMRLPDNLLRNGAFQTTPQQESGSPGQMPQQEWGSPRRPQQEWGSLRQLLQQEWGPQDNPPAGMGLLQTLQQEWGSLDNPPSRNGVPQTTPQQEWGLCQRARAPGTHCQ